MNMFGLMMFVREKIADEIEKRAKVKVELARLSWHADSYHIYGKDIANFKKLFLGRIESSPFESRVMNFRDETIQEMYNEATDKVIAKIAEYDKSHVNK